MIKPIIYHYEIQAEQTYTFNFEVLVGSILVKNLTDGDIKISYGEEIDENSYSFLPTKTSEIIFTSNINREEYRTDKVTVESRGTGIIEIRILDF